MCSSDRPLKETAHDLGVATETLRPGCYVLHSNIRRRYRHSARDSPHAAPTRQL